ncbi:MAG: 50S ribosomal protein L4 [Bacteroidales bacterium]|jgi:large subunit ribosomal protein L4|nr:50S ribosomal protein L4 [Bacteroidales bacterium]MBQ4206633.1 50S ribosomal protein L4 [Bacteroidales bacterium]MBR6092807.1 50S ribosomal protein L4 [Bacteroidales bacterium]
MELEVLKITGESTGRKVQLNENIYGIEPNDHCIYLDTKQFLANQRQGTHKAKTRSEISGSTRKLFRQKGTGGARRGDINSPVLRGGGRVFGPQPRDYGFKLNKKVKQLARRSALSYKMQDAEIVILEDFTFDTIKTKRMIEVLNNLKVNGGKNLFVLPETNMNVVLSARNIQRTKIELARNLNTYDILNAKKLFITESSLAVIDEILG